MSQFKNSDEYESWKAGKLRNPHKRSVPKQPPPPPENKTAKIIKISIVAGILILSISIGYHYFIYTPMNKTQNELDVIEHDARLQSDLKKMEREKKIRYEERIRQLNEAEKRKYQEMEAVWMEEEKRNAEKQQQEELKAQSEAERLKQNELEKVILYKKQMAECIESAWESFHKRWNASCEKLELEVECSLSSEVADSYTNERQENIDNCYRSYDRLTQ